MSEKKTFHRPFEGLASLREQLPEGPTAVAAPANEARAFKLPARAVLRIERAGRRGKEVTVIEHLDLPVPERAHWLSLLKKELGCGGAVEGEALVLQGDHRERAARLLRQRGVGNVKVA